MNVSLKYRQALVGYLEWEHVRTPASGSFQEAKKPAAQIGVADDGVSAEESLCIWESQGKQSFVRPDECELLCRYLLGKSQRDWWSREIGWWNKNGAFIPEEFLGFLGPLPFIELFGRVPITRIVRYYFDNRYRFWEFNLDSLMQAKVESWGMPYYERDDRDSALRNAWRMVRVKWVDPAIWRAKRRFLSTWKLKG
jgi:hypothetical protein